jgi:hypothetical protein
MTSLMISFFSFGPTTRVDKHGTAVPNLWR